MRKRKISRQTHRDDRVGRGAETCAGDRSQSFVRKRRSIPCLESSAICALFVAVVVFIPVVDWSSQPGDVPHIGSAERRAPRATGSHGTPPIVLGGINGTSTGRMIESTYVAHADFVTEQIVEVDIDLSRGIDGNIDVFVTDRISGDDGSDHGRTAATAVDVNSHAARGSRIFFICKIAGD